jgi:hypothetical protein
VLLFFFIFSVTEIQFNFLKYFRHDLNSNLIGSFFAGFLLTIILFALDEYIFNINITGEWNVKEILVETSGPYIGYHLFYTFHLLQKGYEIVGCGEKIRQTESDGKLITFERNKRVRLEVEGYLKRGYLSRTKIYLLIYEHGRRRDTSSIITLSMKEASSFKGNFSSTAADAKGMIEFTKK